MKKKANVSKQELKAEYTDIQSMTEQQQYK